MSSRMRIAAGLAVAVFAAACSDSTPTTLPTSGSAPGISFKQDKADDTPHPAGAEGHSHELRDSPAAKAAGHGGGGGTGIQYHGGPVLQAATNVVAVYWSSSPVYNGGPAAGTTGSGAQDGSLIGYFLRNLGGSSYFNINTTYKDGAGNAIKNIVNYNGFWANNTNVPGTSQSVSDASMIAMLQSGFDSNALTYDANTLYLIFTAGKTNLGGGFGSSYCAYHWYGNVSIGGQSKRVLYAAMPYDAAYPSACTNGTAAPNADQGADAEVNTLAHEIEETTTDMYGTAWYDNRGYENADKCAWNFGTTHSNGTGIYNITVGSKNFLVQQNWINSGTGGCRQGL